MRFQKHFTLKAHQIHLRPDAGGMILLISSVLSLILAFFDPMQSFLWFSLAGFIGVILFTAAAFSFYQLHQLHLHITPQNDFFAGNLAKIALNFHDDKPRLFALRIELCHRPQKHDENDTMKLSAWQNHQNEKPTMLLSLPLQTCGAFPSPFYLRFHAAPLGFISAQSRLLWDHDLWIYPQPLPHKYPLITHHHENDASELRRHQQNTPISKIAWKASAKRGIWLEKHDTHSIQHTNAIQQISHRDYPANTTAQHLASLLCYRVIQAQKKQNAYVLILPEQQIPPAPKQYYQCLIALAKFAQTKSKQKNKAQ